MRSMAKMLNTAQREFNHSNAFEESTLQRVEFFKTLQILKTSVQFR